MKKLKLLFLAMMMIVANVSLADIVIGDGTGTAKYTPLDPYYEYSFCQSLYHSSELGTGEITSLKLFKVTDETADFNDLKIYIKTTSDTETPLGLISDGALVFEGDVHVGSSEGWFEITLDTPYYYDVDEGNLIVAFKDDDGEYDGLYYMWTSHLGTTSCVSSNTDMYYPTSFGYHSSNRPDMTFVGLSLLAPANLTGHVYNNSGMPISGAVISIDGTNQAITDENGVYSVAKIPAELDHTVVCKRQGYNIQTAEAFFTENEDKVIDFTLNTPSPIVNPTAFYEILQPNEHRMKHLGLTNNGNGNFNWTAEIELINDDARTQRFQKEAVRFSCDNSNNSMSFKTSSSASKKNTELAIPNRNNYLRDANIYTSRIYPDTKFGTVTYASAPDIIELADLPDGGANNPFTGAAFPLNTEDYMYGIYLEGETYKVNLSDGAAEFEFLGTLDQRVIDMAVNPVTGEFLFTNGENLYIFDAEAFTTTLVGSHGIENVAGLAIDGEGNAYAHTLDDIFYTIDLATGLATEVGSIGVNTNYLQTLHWDPESDQIIMGFCDDTAAEIRLVDVSTGATSLIATLGDTEYSSFAQPIIGGSGGWLTLNKYEGSVNPMGGIENVEVHFDALGRVPGEILKANIHINTDETLGLNYVIPVTMEIAGDAVPVCEELIAVLTSNVEGTVNLNWIFPSTPNLDHFKIFRNGEAIATPSNNSYQDLLPAYGTYTYKVTAVLNDGTETSPAGPAEIVWLLPELCELETELEENVWVENFEYVYTTIKNCGDGELKFNFPELMANGELGFITEAEPASGVILPGEEAVVRLKYDATDFAIGAHTQDITLATNALEPNNEVVIENTMNVYKPAKFFGVVRNGNTNARLGGVEVKATSATDTYLTETNDQGKYTLLVDADEYELTFSKIGYQPANFTGLAVTVETPVEQNALLYEMPYSPAHVVATVNVPQDTECLVEWGLPQGPYELLYDDGTIENHTVGVIPGIAAAVKYTPKGYPAIVTGAKFNVGDGSFPINGSFIGSKIHVSINKATEAGLPGDVIAEQDVTVDNFGWVVMNEGFNAVVEAGDFFVVLTQLAGPNESAPIGVDQTVPTAYKSFAYTEASGWTTSPLQDLMIRAIVAGPDDNNIISLAPAKRVNLPKMNEMAIVQNPASMVSGIEKSAMAVARPDLSTTDVVSKYIIERIAVEDPNKNFHADPSTLLSANLNGLSYNDAAYAGLSAGFYAYKVRAKYTNTDLSEWAYSNIVAHKRYSTVTVDVDVQTSDPVTDAKVILTGLDYPYETYEFVTTTDDGIAIFPLNVPQDWFFMGRYNLEVSKVGYYTYAPDNYFEIFTTDFFISVILQEKKYPIRDLYVDPLTSIATWSDPLVTALYEEFEGEEFLPAEWQKFNISTEEDSGWFKGSNGTGSSSNFSIPARDGFFAVSNDELAGSSSDGSMDYLITPVCDLRESADFALIFDSYYTGANGSIATIEYSLDNGENWIELETINPSPADAWSTENVDLSALSGIDSGEESIHFAFHLNDAGEYATGWAIDNVRVTNGVSDYIDFHVFLDDAFQGETELYTWWFPNLTYGKTYTASVAVKYETGLSTKDYYTWKSVFLIPPYDFEGSTYDKQTILNWNSPKEWVGEYLTGDHTGAIPENLVGFNIYRDDLEEVYEFVAATFADSYTYTDDAEPGVYDYYVSAVYDITKFGYPTERAESEVVGPINIDLTWGFGLPFSENWNGNNFEDKNWNTEGNWEINPTANFDGAAAMFKFNPIVTDYKMAITTAFLNASELEVGNIYLDFVYNLDINKGSGNEMLLVQINSGTTWNTVATFKNNENVAWEQNHIDLTNRAMGKVFQIRFMAKGANSADIRSWMVDNINIYRDCAKAPTDMKYDLKGDETDLDPADGIYLNWQHEITTGGGTADEWIHHDSQELGAGLALETFTGDIYAACNISAEMLTDYEGMNLDQVRVALGTAVQTAQLLVWKNNDFTTPIHTQNIAVADITAGDWTTITLSSEIAIEAATSYQYGFKLNVIAQQAIIGYDGGPAVVGQGDLISTNGIDFSSAGSLITGLNNNWNMGIHVGNSTDDSRATASYVIYRKDVTAGSDFVEIAEVSELSYFDPRNTPENNLVWKNVYAYEVKAKMVGETEECYSEVLATDDILYEVIGLEESIANNMKVYPNPTNGKVNIKSDVTINRIQLSNTLGQLISVTDVNADSYELDLSNLKPGIYMVKIETENNMIVKKITRK